MKICVCGKGGCGKSTVVSLLALAFRSAGRDVIVLDADESNTSLFRMLGFERPPQDLMDYIGGKKLAQKKMRARFSKGEGEPAMSIMDTESISIDSIPAEYIAVRDGVRLLSTGKIRQAMEGCACPMGSLTREILKKIKLEENQIMLVDAEAGVEHFGRGVEAEADAVIAVVEPSLESISLAGKIMDLTRSSGSLFHGAILNKISSESRKEYVSGKLEELNVKMIGAVRFNDEVQSAGLEGLPVPGQAASEEITDIVDEFLRNKKVKRV